MAIMLSESAIALPFSIDVSGKVAVANTQTKIWEDRVLSVLGTTVRERLLLPNFGTLIPYALFENSDSAESEVKAEVTKAFALFLSALTVQSIDVSFDYTSGSINISVVYTLPNSTSTTTTLGIIALSGSNPSYEVTL